MVNSRRAGVRDKLVAPPPVPIEKTLHTFPSNEIFESKGVQVAVSFAANVPFNG